MNKRLQLSNVVAWQRNSFIDFPRTVSTVLFFSGCNLRCPYCHNCSIVNCELPAIDSDEFWSFLDKRRKFIDGVVLTGGEPTIHTNLHNVIREIKSFGYRVKLDTNGLLPDNFIPFYNEIDYLAMDVKTSPALYKDKLKSHYDDNAERLQRSVDIIRQFENGQAEIRITAVPGLLNEDICHDIGKLIEGVDVDVFFQDLSTKNEMMSLSPEDIKPFEDDEIEKFIQILSKYVNNCKRRKK